MRLFKFQWQNVNDKYLGPGFASVSPQWKSKFGGQKNRVIFAILRSLVSLFSTKGVKNVSWTSLFQGWDGVPKFD